MPQGKTRQNNFNQKNPSLRPNDNFSLKRAMQPTYNPYIQPTEPKKQFISKIEQDVLKQLQPLKDQLVPPTVPSVENEYDVTRGGLNNLPTPPAQDPSLVGTYADYEAGQKEYRNLENKLGSGEIKFGTPEYEQAMKRIREVGDKFGLTEYEARDFTNQQKMNDRKSYWNNLNPNKKPTPLPPGTPNPSMKLF